MRTSIALAVVGLLTLLSLPACSTQFDGPEKVQGLRLLAVKAEPPELGAALDGSGAGWPADAAILSSLVAHPAYATAAGPAAIVLHLACTPTPGDPSGTACTQISALAEPADLLGSLSAASACADPGRGQVNAITFSGLEACDHAGCGPLSVPLDPGSPGATVSLPSPRYRLPADLSMASLAAGHPQRIVGLDVVDLALVVQAAPAEVAPTAPVTTACEALGAVLQRLGAVWEQREHVAALKWIHVRGPDMPADNPPNHNPSVAGIAAAADGSGWHPTLTPDFGGQSFESLRERYTRYDTEGRPVDTRDETWAYSWFTTGGDLDRAHTDSGDPANVLDLAQGTSVVWLVVRDLRGGEAWTQAVVASP